MTTCPDQRGQQAAGRRAATAAEAGSRQVTPTCPPAAVPVRLLQVDEEAGLLVVFLVVHHPDCYPLPVGGGGGVGHALVQHTHAHTQARRGGGYGVTPQGGAGPTFPFTHLEQPRHSQLQEEVLVFLVFLVINNIDHNRFTGNRNKQTHSWRRGRRQRRAMTL